MTRRVLPVLALAAVLAACPALRSPDERARDALADLSARGFELPVEGAHSLQVPPGKLAFTGVTAEARDGGMLVAFGQLSLEGWLAGKPVSYLGAERFEVACGRTCEVEGPPAPRLAAVLREVAAGAEARGAAGWFIRVERDAAIVGEASRDGSRRRLHLVREGDRFVRAEGPR